MDKSMIIKYNWRNNILQAYLGNEAPSWPVEMTEAILLFLNLNCREFPGRNSSKVVFGCYRGQTSSTKQMDLHFHIWKKIQIIVLNSNLNAYFTMGTNLQALGILISCFSEIYGTTSSHAHTSQALHWVCDNFSQRYLYILVDKITELQLTFRRVVFCGPHVFQARALLVRFFPLSLFFYLSKVQLLRTSSNSIYRSHWRITLVAVTKYGTIRDQGQLKKKLLFWYVKPYFTILLALYLQLLLRIPSQLFWSMGAWCMQMSVGPP